MVKSSLWRRAFARGVVDVCVPRGLVPTHGILDTAFRWSLAGRDVRLGRRHPLSQLCARSEWSSSYALSTASLSWLWWRVTRVRPKAVIEVGSGRSTVMFALYARAMEQAGLSTPVVLSLEHDADWLAQTAGMLDALGVRKYATLLHSPLGEIGADARFVFQLSGDQVRAALGPLQAEFVLIDGPPSSVGRQDTLPILSPYLAGGAEVFLDDSDRPAERAMISEWNVRFGDPAASSRVLPLGKGLGWFRTRRRTDEK